MGKIKGSRTKKPPLSDKTGNSNFNQDEFDNNLGHHYDSTKGEGRRRKKQSRDLFEDKEITSSGASGWGMMMGGIEVVDANQYLVVKPKSTTKVGSKKEPVAPEACSSYSSSDDDNNDDDDEEEDPFSDCKISDEEGDIMILEPGEKKPDGKKNNSDYMSGGVDWEGELEKGEWDDSDEGDLTAKAKLNAKPDAKAEAKVKKKAEAKAKKALAPPAPPPLTPFIKKTKTLSSISNLLQYHKPTSALTTNWQITCSGITLPRLVAHNFVRLGYEAPMAIQSATLPSAVLGRRDIVGAAPTGSGKTLCYGLSVVMGCLKDLINEVEDAGGMKALILVPTRELAMQVTKEISGYCKVPDEKLLCELRGDSKKKKKKNKKAEKIIQTEGICRVGTIVGGLSKEKQERVLKSRPEIIVATPGRLWELMSSREHPHLNDFTCLKFLVIDEADRMVKQGNFPQLEKIFEDINEEEQSESESESESEEESGSGNGSEIESGEEEEEEGDEESERESNEGDSEEEMTEAEIEAFLGFNPEPSTKLLSDDILAGIEEIKKTTTPSDIRNASPKVIRNETTKKASKGKLDKSLRQTFIYSATLTLPKPEMKDKTDGKQKKQKSKKNTKEEENILEVIMEKAGSRGVIKVVDLSVEGDEPSSASNKPSKQEPSNNHKTVKLPPGLTLYQARCTQLHKDSYTYAFLSTTAEGTKGPSIVFCNSIGGVKRVARTLEELGMKVRSIHADMPQKQRFKALEALGKPESRCVLVATDVAARGIDIPEVASVIHYDLPRSGGVDTFVHRSGRTARGVGTSGTSLSLIGSKEEKIHTQICRAVNGVDAVSGKVIDIEMAPLDAHLLAAAQERANLAEKIVKMDEAEQKKAASNNWFAKAAEDAGLDLDDGLMEELEGQGGVRDMQKYKEAEHARNKLRQLLKKPMRKQRFGKFLSSGIKRTIQASGGVAGGLGVRVEEEKILNKHGKVKRRRR